MHIFHFDFDYLDNSQTVTSSDVSSDYQAKPVQQGSTSLQSQLISNSDSLIGNQNENLSTTGYNTRQNSSVTQSASANTLANASAGM